MHAHGAAGTLRLELLTTIASLLCVTAMSGRFRTPASGSHDQSLRGIGARGMPGPDVHPGADGLRAAAVRQQTSPARFYELEEPLAADHPLLALPKVTVAPHVAWLTRETWQRSISIALHNTLAVRDGTALLHRVA